MAKQLRKYQTMRDFGQTPEPSGRETARRKKKPIFVIQKHHASHLHYDFRLEMEGVLKSWAVPKGPSYDPNIRRLAMMTEDHPYAYKDFEGVIPEGNYGAGNVIVWDYGTWTFIEPGDDPVDAVKKGKLTFELNGKKMIGEWALVRIHSKSGKGNEWLLLKHRDQYATSNFDVTEEAPRSILSNLDVDELVSTRVWKSNRAAAPARRARTLADEAAKPKRAASAKRGAPKKAAAKRATTKSSARTTTSKKSAKRRSSAK